MDQNTTCKTKPTSMSSLYITICSHLSQARVLWIFIYVAFIAGSRVSGTPVPCQHPENNTLKNQWTRLHTAQNVTSSASRQASRIASIIESSKASERTCPTTPSNDPNQPEERRSLCPWAYRINHDPTRYPVDLPEAVCLCRNCISSGANSCEAVYYEVPVLRQTQQCNSGAYVYRESFQKIAVGCTCTQPRIAIAQPIPRGGPDLSGF